MKEYLDEQDLAKKEAVEEMLKLLRQRYDVNIESDMGKKYFMSTGFGGDAGDLYKNGTYHIGPLRLSFLKHSPEFIMQELDKYFEV